MLVIRRRAGEGLVITYPGGERLEVELLEIEGSQIKLGFQAPRQVRVLRREIAETESANRAASLRPEPVALDRLSARLASLKADPPRDSASSPPADPR